MDFQALKTAHAEEPDFLKLVPVARGLIPRREIKEVLLVLDKLAAVEQAVPQFYHDPDFERIDIADLKTQGVLTQLQTASVLSADDMMALNALATAQVPRWKALGYSEAPHAGDIAYALSLP